jgi:3-oxoacyl-[acyl-carrier protein] reductase
LRLRRFADEPSPRREVGVIDLRGRRALVTGASRGIGAATAELLASLGAEVAVHFHHDAAAAQRVVQAIESKRGTSRAFQASLSEWDEGERLVAAVEETMGAVDTVVLNHGVWKEAAIDAMTSAQYDETLDANLRGYMSVAGASARRMKPRRSGRIVFVASTAGQRGEALHSHYAATKGAAISVTKSLASELAPFGVLVNCVAPGWVATDMSADALADEVGRAKVFGAIPLGRVGRPEEIAWPIAFLASDAATFVTGEILNVNGGAVLVG